MLERVATEVGDDETLGVTVSFAERVTERVLVGVDVDEKVALGQAPKPTWQLTHQSLPSPQKPNSEQHAGGVHCVPAEGPHAPSTEKGRPQKVAV